MMILITYDVETTTPSGAKRLRQVAKVCTNYGQRVQNSVFECSVNPEQLLIIKHKINGIIDKECDSIRFYNLGKNWQRRVETLGKNDTYDPDQSVLIL